MTAKSTGHAPFVELDPIVVQTTVVPKVTNLDVNGHVIRKPRALRPLPDLGPGVVRVQPIGGRLVMRPADRAAADALGAARASLGWHWDAKSRRHVYHLDNFLRRGVTEWDSLRLLSAMTGLPLEMADGVERSIERYRSRLERQLRPIPRVTWFDETASEDNSELEKEISLGNNGAALRRWGIDGGWWGKKNP